MKQIVDAWSERLRSPFLGSIALSFVVINWKVLFYLFFADEPVHARILYFEENTNRDCLVWYPLAFGVALALLSPWLTLIGAWLARKPKDWVHYLQDDAARDRRIREYSRKADEEAALARFEAEQEQRKIDRAKRLEEAREVEGTDLEGELVSDREERERQSASSQVDELEAFEKLVIIALGAHGGEPPDIDQLVRTKGFSEESAKLKEHISVQRLRVESEAALKKLQKLGLASVNLGEWTLTSDGYAAFDRLQEKRSG